MSGNMHVEIKPLGVHKGLSVGWRCSRLAAALVVLKGSPQSLQFQS